MLARLARVDVLILDDWGLAAVTDVQRQDLLEVMEDRDATRSTIITSQLPARSVARVSGRPDDRRRRPRSPRPQCVSDHAERPVATQGESLISSDGPWTLPDPWTRGRAHRSLEIAPRFPQRPPPSSDDERRTNAERTTRPYTRATITGGEHRITYPAAQRRFAPITMPWSP